MLKMKDNNYINNIAAIRKKHGISQTQFANAIGVETSTISRIETGKSDPSAVTLFAIAKYLQVSVDEFYTRKTAEQIKNESRNFSREILDIMYQQLKVRKILKTNIFSKYGVYAVENQNYFRYSLDTFLKGVWDQLS